MFLDFFNPRSKNLLKEKNPGSGNSLYDLVLNALDESRLGRTDFNGASAYEIARRIHRIDHKYSDYDIERVLEELAKTGLVKKVVLDPLFFKEIGRDTKKENEAFEKLQKTSSK